MVGVCSDWVVREGLCGEMALDQDSEVGQKPSVLEMHCELLQGRKSTSVSLQKGSGVEWLVRVKGLGEVGKIDRD